MKAIRAAQSAQGGLFRLTRIAGPGISGEGPLFDPLCFVFPIAGALAYSRVFWSLQPLQRRSAPLVPCKPLHRLRLRPFFMAMKRFRREFEGILGRA
jgi:hypothetical protein